MTLIRFKKILLPTLLAVAMTPALAFAATISLSTPSNTIHVGDTVVVDVRIDTQGATVNLAEGTIDLTHASTLSEVTDLSVADSVLTLWPRTPSLAPDGKSITFTGGTPNGFTSSGSSLFKIVFVAKKAGLFNVHPQLINVYLNDGKGTLAPVQMTDLNIMIAPSILGAAPQNEWHDQVSADKTAPQAFTVVAGHDASLFGGQTFLAFNTTDTGSGVDHYQVVEGNLPPVRTGDTYVLQNQNTSETITVTAYDKAGNARTTIYHTPVASSVREVPFVLGLLLLVYALYQLYAAITGRKIKE